MPCCSHTPRRLLTRSDDDHRCEACCDPMKPNASLHHFRNAEAQRMHNHEHKLALTLQETSNAAA